VCRVCFFIVSMCVQHIMLQLQFSLYLSLSLSFGVAVAVINFKSCVKSRNVANAAASILWGLTRNHAPNSLYFILIYIHIYMHKKLFLCVFICCHNMEVCVCVCLYVHYTLLTAFFCSYLAAAWRKCVRPHQSRDIDKCAYFC